MNLPIVSYSSSRPAPIALQQPAASPESQPEEISRTTLDRMEEYFDRWDRNENGLLAWSEIRANVADQSIKGEEAATLASLYSLVERDVIYRGLEQTPPVTYNKLFDLYHEYDDESSEADFPPSIAEYYYHKFSGKLRNSSTELMPQGEVRAEAARQGAAPSCGFLATTFAEVKKNPEQLSSIIKPTENGMLEVHFPGMDESIEVSAPTPTERALFSTAEDNGNWITVLEKAWGQHQAGRNPLTAFEKDTYPEDAIEAWTGRDAITTRVPKTTKVVKPGELPHYLRTSGASLEADRTVVAWTKFDLPGKNFVPGHAYTVTGIDAEEGTVTLRNPWGHKEPVGEDGKPLDGENDGIFELSFQTFQKSFKHIARETA